ncbi:hypothetical protein [Acrocarpospora sp. B8E8]|uniref:hypothetical protein n=1 Tax=Acrocarpospora sp. B8E8 TaxID=3153572 RepID=UPI00325EE3AA
MNFNITHPSKTVLVALMAAPWAVIGVEVALNTLAKDTRVILAIGAGVINVCTVALRVATRFEKGCRLIAQTVDTNGQLHRETVQNTAKEHAEQLGTSVLNPVALMAAGWRGKALAAHDIAKERENRRTDRAFDEMGTGPFGTVR